MRLGDETTLADALMAPTAIYVKDILGLIGEAPIKAMAHITGGGLVENIVRVVPDALGLAVDASRGRSPPCSTGCSARATSRTTRCGARSTAVGFVVMVAAEAAAATRAALDRLGLRTGRSAKSSPGAEGERLRIR